MESNVTPIKFRNEGKKYKRARQDGGILRMDFALFFTVIAICLFGIVMLFSASYYKGISEFGDGYHFVKSQIEYFAIGVVVMLGVSFIPYSLYRKRISILLGYIAIIALLILTLVKGKTVLGAKRWVQLGPINMQPSELVKFILIICISAYMSRFAGKMNKFPVSILGVLALIVLPCALIYLQPNMSMLIIICAVTFLMMFMGGAKLKHLAILAVIGVIGLIVLSLAKGYRSGRFTSWLHPWDDPKGSSYQVVQSLFAFGNGGLFGQGLDASRQKLLFLPEMENDYILAIIAEELGFVGVLALMLAYMFVIYRGIRVALSVKDRFAALVAGGITAMLAVQIIVNIAVVTNSIPATGQTLPFISAGGSSLVVFMGATGILLNISRYAEKRRTPLFPKRKTAEDLPAEQSA